MQQLYKVYEKETPYKLVAADLQGENNMCVVNYEMPKMVSGNGQRHTNKASKKGRPYLQISLADIFAIAKRPPQLDKEKAQWVIPSTLLSRVYAEQRDKGSFYFLWADIDKPSITAQEIFERVRSNFNSDCLVYTTRSATKTKQKSRIILPLNAACSGDEFIRLQQALNRWLMQEGIEPDQATERAGQLCYLPNKGEFYRFFLELSLGPLDWRTKFEDCLEIEQKTAIETEKLAVSKRVGNSVIDAFNARQSVEELLLRYGYKAVGDKWLSPNSASGSAGVMIKDGRWVSMHESDAKIGRAHSQGTSGDAFDLFVGYECSGDFSLALEKAKSLIGPHQNNLMKKMEKYPLPRAIPNELALVDEFDPFLLPDEIRPWIEDIADRMQCPLDFLAIGAIVGISSLIGRKAVIKPKRFDDWEVTPNLWGAVVGRPGVMKSPALSAVLRPLSCLSNEAKKQFEKMTKDYENAEKIQVMSLRSAEKKAQQHINKGNKDKAIKELQKVEEEFDSKPPFLRRYQVNDATVEALGEILIENPTGVLVYRDELAGLLSAMDKEGQEGARSFYLQAYDGNQSYTFDRIVRGRNLHLEAVCFSLLGGIQPSKLESYIYEAVNGGQGDDGLLQRFGLLVWPDIQGKWKNIDRKPDINAERQAFEVFERLAKLEMLSNDEATLTPHIYSFSDAAQNYFDDWRYGFENDLRQTDRHQAVESHLAKYRKLVPALALIFTLIDNTTIVEIEAVKRAVSWSEYLIKHVNRVYTAGLRMASRSAKALKVKIKSKTLGETFTARDVYRKGWVNLNSVDLVLEALQLLIELDYLFECQNPSGKTGGRPQTVYRVNPRVFE